MVACITATTDADTVVEVKSRRSRPCWPCSLQIVLSPDSPALENKDEEEEEEEENEKDDDEEEDEEAAGKLGCYTVIIKVIQALEGGYDSDGWYAAFMP